MAINRLRLNDGRLSLEFASGHKPIVRMAIAEVYGLPEKKTEYTTFTIYRIGNAELIYRDEWEDPCLISGSDEGDAVLTAVIQRLSCTI
jgi:hypothetical protein